MFSPLRRSMAAAAILAVGGTVALSAATPAAASFPGTAGRLTASDGNAITVVGGAPLYPIMCYPDGNCSRVSAFEAKWSPDGSRAVFVNHHGDLQTIRFDDDTAYTVPVWADDDSNFLGQREPTYTDSGSTITYTAELELGGKSVLRKTSSSEGWTSWTVSPADEASYTHPDGGPNGSLVYQRMMAGINEVWYWNGRGAANEVRTKLADGREPAISPDGTKVAFASDANRIYVVNIDGTDLHKVTDDVSGEFSNPTWSHDGTTIAFNNNGYEVRTVAAAGGTSSGTGIGGKPAYQPENKNKVVRLSGAGRFETAAAVSQYWQSASDASDTRPKAASVTLSRSDSFADALGGSALAAAKTGPLLMTEPKSLTEATAAEIDRVLDPGGKVYILGSVGAISQAVEDKLNALGYSIERVAGADRYATAVAIANEINPNPTSVLVATGANFPDALAAGAAAGSYNTGGSTHNAVVVLTDDARPLPTATRSYLNAQFAKVAGERPDVYGIGKAAADRLKADYPQKTRTLAGKDRYETAWIVAAVFFGGQRSAGVATAMNWPDALAGGALLGTINGPLLLTDGKGPELHWTAAWSLNANSASVSTVYVFGGTSVVNNTQRDQAGVWSSGPAKYATGTAFLGGSPTMLRSAGAGVTGTDDASVSHRTREQIIAAAENVKVPTKR